VALILPPAAWRSDTFSKCRTLTDQIVDDFVSNAKLTKLDRDALAPALRSVLFSIVARIDVDAESLQTLRKYQREKGNDPLLLACLVRAIDNKADDYKTLCQEFFKSRDQRKLSVEANGFFQNTLLFVLPYQTAFEHAELVGGYLQPCADLWQWIATEKPSKAIYASYFLDTTNVVNKLNFDARCDLLVELDHGRVAFRNAFRMICSW